MNFQSFSWLFRYFINIEWVLLKINKKSVMLVVEKELRDKSAETAYKIKGSLDSVEGLSWKKD